MLGWLLLLLGDTVVILWRHIVGILRCRAAGVRRILLHFHGDLLAVFGVVGVGRGTAGGGGGAGVAVLPHPPGGRAEGDEEEDAGKMGC